MTPGLPYKPPKPGSPIFLSIPATDVQRAYKFYSAVFDWSFYADNDKQPAEFSKDEIMLFDFEPDVRLSGGIQRVKEGEGPVRTGRGGVYAMYIVKDLGLSATAVEKAGGKITSEVEKEAEDGLMRYFEDTEGNTGVLYQFVGVLAE